MLKFDQSEPVIFFVLKISGRLKISGTAKLWGNARLDENEVVRWIKHWIYASQVKKINKKGEGYWCCQALTELYSWLSDSRRNRHWNNHVSTKVWTENANMGLQRGDPPPPTPVVPSLCLELSVVILRALHTMYQRKSKRISTSKCIVLPASTLVFLPTPMHFMVSKSMVNPI